MEDVTKNMNDLFNLAKNAKVEYSINNVTTVISSAGAGGAAAGGTSTFFNLSNIAIMLGSIMTIATVAVVVSTGENESPNKVENSIPVVENQLIERQYQEFEYPERTFIEENELVSPVMIDDEAPIEEFAIVVDEIIENDPPDLILSEEQKAVSGNGGIAPFHSVHLNIGADVTIVKGDKPGVAFDGNRELAQYLEAQVSNGVLQIGFKAGMEREYKRKASYDNSIEVVVTMSEIKTLVINGSGDIYSADDIEADELSIQINGSGDVRLDKIVPQVLDISVNGSGDVSLYGQGDISNGAININGSGDVCTKAIDISDLGININGSGDVNVTCQNTLNVTILGSGDVCYSGSPTVNLNSLGSGDVHSCD